MEESSNLFAIRLSIEQVEEGNELAPKFGTDGLIPVVTTDYDTGYLLMHGYMNRDALDLTIRTQEAHYWSRSRNIIWHKGATSGLFQMVREMRIDDDQDAVWLRVSVKGSGGSCHVGYRSCFYRSVTIGGKDDMKPARLTYEEEEKLFDPNAVYGEVENPTKL